MKKTTHEFRRVLRSLRGMVALFLVMGIGAAFLDAFSAGYFQTVVDRFVDGSLSLPVILLYGGALILLYSVNYVENLPRYHLSNGIYLRFKLRALEKIGMVDFRSYQSLGTGGLVQRIENGAAAGKGILFDFWLRLFQELVPGLLFSLLFITAIDPQITLWLLAGYVLVFLFSNLLLKYLYRIKERILDNEEAFNHHLVRGFMELAVFRVNRRFRREIALAEGAAEEIVSAKTKMKLIHEAFFTAFALLVAGVKIGILLYGWLRGGVSVGSVVALLTLVDRAYTPIAIFNVLYVQYRLDCSAYRRFADFLELPDDPQLGAGAPCAPLRGEVELREVSYSYGGNPVFQSLSLRLPPGGSVAFVGESGSGKSTAVKLIIGLLKPDSGALLVDGRDLSGLDLDSFYRHISYISQDPPVFDGTLLENIVFDREVERAEVEAALELVELGGLLGTLPQGLDTPVGERGVLLSGGERQRLALARLFFQDAGLVVLDEATSALDAVTEDLVMGRVLERLRGRTLILIAHRMDTARRADRVALFRRGSLEALDTWDNLLTRSAYFRQLCAPGPRPWGAAPNPTRG